MTTLRELAEIVKLKEDAAFPRAYNAGIDALLDAIVNSTELEVVSMEEETQDWSGWQDIGYLTDDDEISFFLAPTPHDEISSRYDVEQLAPQAREQLAELQRRLDDAVRVPLQDQLRAAHPAFFKYHLKMED